MKFGNLSIKWNNLGWYRLTKPFNIDTVLTVKMKADIQAKIFEEKRKNSKWIFILFNNIR